MAQQHTGEDSRVPLDELVERMWTALEYTPGLVAGGSLTQEVAYPTTDAEGFSALVLAAGMEIDAAKSALGAKHSRGEAWLRSTFSQLDRYQRKGGGLDLDGAPVPAGLRPVRGCLLGCGDASCARCYEQDEDLPVAYVARAEVYAYQQGTSGACTLARTADNRFFLGGHPVVAVGVCESMVVLQTKDGRTARLWPTDFWRVVCPQDIAPNDELDLGAELGWLFASASLLRRELEALLAHTRSLAAACEQGGWPDRDLRSPTYDLLQSGQLALLASVLPRFNAQAGGGEA